MQAIIRDILENAINQYHNDTKYVHSDKISVTEALYCLRKAFYYRTLEDSVLEKLIEESPYSDSDFYLFVGKVIHSKIQEYISKTAKDALSETNFSYEDTLCEVKVEDDLLVGHIDLIIQTDKLDIPIELKTCKKLPRNAYPQHKYQLSTYMNMAKDDFEIKYGYIVYISRIEGDIKVVTVAPKKSRYEFVRTRANTLIDHIKRNEIPEAEDDPFCWKCVFYKICKKG